MEVVSDWGQNRSRARSLVCLGCRAVKEKAAILQRNACRLSRDKAISTNRKAKASVVKDADGLLKAAEAYAA